MPTKRKPAPKPPLLVRKVKIDGTWKMLSVARGAGLGGFSWNKVVHLKNEIAVSEGTFYLDYRENGRKVKRAVGDDPKLALEALRKQTVVLAVRAEGMEAGDAPEIYDRPGGAAVKAGPTIADVIGRFIARPPVGLRTRTLGNYRVELEEFQAWAKTRRLTYLSEFSRHEVKEYMQHLVGKQGLEVRTAVRKAGTVLKQMRDAGAQVTMLRGDWPRFTEPEPTVYTPEQLRGIFRAMTRDEFELYQTFLQTGFRDQEVGFLERPDFNARRGLLSVRKKAGLKFDPKSYAERTIAIPPMLVEILGRRIARMEDRERLIFGTSTKNIGRGQLGGQRDGHMLRKLKRIALRAGMNCGRCHAMYLKKPACCRDTPMCEEWTLHKFRHTYATMQLQGTPERPGVDVRTLQKLLGHAKLETTMKYLHMLPEAALAEKIATSTLATMFSCADGERSCADGESKS